VSELGAINPPNSPPSMRPPAATAAISPELADAVEKIRMLTQELSQVIRGQKVVLEQMMICLLCGGHALLEGVPGLAKTLMVRTLALGLTAQSKRIQFTPDLMPSDVVGTNVFSVNSGQFTFHAGPVFTDLLLADEINRAPAKTQSALLEAMSERACTVDGIRHELSPVFTVFATQNPIEFEGTYPLPEAQQDRFLMKIKVDYPELEAERSLLEAVHRGDPPDRLSPGVVKPVLSVEQLRRIQAALPGVRAEQPVVEYILKIIRITRETDSILVGAGPRGGIFLLQASKAHALLRGRDFLTPDDVVAMVNPVLAHRITLTAEAEISGATRDEVLHSVLGKIEVPR
jgi:MoxR-like ATPase